MVERAQSLLHRERTQKSEKAQIYMSLKKGSEVSLLEE